MTGLGPPPEDGAVKCFRPALLLLLPLSLGAALAAHGALAQPAQPNPPPVRPSPAQTLDRLFGLLAVAPDDASASAVEEAIQGQWIAEATPATKLLLMHGFKALTESQPNDAFDDFNAALDLQPDLSEGWHGRALARARLGDTAGAERDIEHVIRLEPRQFAALEDLSHMAETAGDWQGALAAWQEALEIDPRAPGGAERLKELRRRAFGDPT